MNSATQELQLLKTLRASPTRSQTVIVDGQSSRRVNITSGVPQGSVLGPLLYNIYTRELANILENVFVGYADDSTLLAIIPSPKSRVMVACSLIRDLVRLQAWCTVWGMLLNLVKTKAMLLSRSRTKLTSEKHLRFIVSSAVQKIGVLRRARNIYQDGDIVARCFWSLLLPILEYCSPVWSSAVDGHLNLLDGVVRRVTRLSNGLAQCDLWHRRNVASLCMLFKIGHNAGHPLHPHLPRPMAPARALRHNVRRHRHQLTPINCRTGQYQRSFVPRTTNLWNGLGPNVVFDGGLQRFKKTVHCYLRQA